MDYITPKRLRKNGESQNAVFKNCVKRVVLTELFALASYGQFLKMHKSP